MRISRISTLIVVLLVGSGLTLAVCGGTVSPGAQEMTGALTVQ